MLVLSLIFSTVALTLVLHDKYLAFKNKRQENEQAFREWSPEMVAPSPDVTQFEKDPTKSLASPSNMTVDDHFNEAFVSSDDGFTGINEDFGV